MRLLLIALFVSLVTGCAALPTLKRPQSFDSYEDFWPGPANGVDLVWAAPKLRSPETLATKIAYYDSVVIDRVWLVVDNQESYGSLSADEVDQLTLYLVEQLKLRISKRFKLVSSPTAATMRISLAITNIDTPNPILAVTSSVLPFGLGVSAISTVVTGEPTNVGAATIEAKVSDATTGEVLFAAIDRKAGYKDFGTIIDSSDDARDAIDFWVERLGASL